MKTALISIFALAFASNAALAEIMNAYKYLPVQQTIQASRSAQQQQRVFSTDASNEFSADGSSWLRLFFNRAQSKISRGTRVRIFNAEGDEQIMSVQDLENWSFSTAYFNGDRLQVEVLPSAAEAAAVEDVLVVDRIQAEDRARPNSICNQKDERVLSHTARDARMFPTGCSVWLINDKKKCFLTAGHCYYGSRDVIQFNVPLSDSRSGAVRHPKPKDQYPMDGASIQYQQGTGYDWMYFGTRENSAGRTAYGAQKSYYDLMPLDQLAKLEEGEELRITGYGTAKGDRNQVQKTHNGTIYAAFPNKNAYALGYRVDTTPGNSGSAIEHPGSGYAVGIHTLGGCYWSGGMSGFNAGTRLSSPKLQEALKNPKGICA